MHELRLARDLVGKVDTAACEQGARRVVGVKVTLGALSGVSADHLRRHFAEAAHGTSAEGARLETILEADATAPNADGLQLESIDIEE
jgi:hydrogenase nickel incorporation protein HypA/HybF